MKKAILLIALISCFSCKQTTEKPSDTAQKASKVTETKNDIERIEPPHWWIGFKNTKLQLLVKHPNIANATPTIANATIKIEKVQKGESPNYLFIDLNIEKASAGRFNIEFELENNEILTQTYQLKLREKHAENYIGFDSSDVLYLITPDRFANANPENDTFKNMNETDINRKDDYARHGGDIKGITNHLNYIDDLGFTAIWFTPIALIAFNHQS